MIPSMLKDMMLKELTEGELFPLVYREALVDALRGTGASPGTIKSVVEVCAIVAHRAWLIAGEGLGHSLVRGAWRVGEFAIERETGKLWKIIDVDIGRGRMLMEPPWCKNKSEHPEDGGEWVWQDYETREARWTQEGLSR